MSEKTTDVEERIISLLEREDIDYKRLTHEPVFTSKQASEVRGVPLHTGVKAMVLEREGDGLILALVPADHRVDLDSVGRCAGGEVELATPDDVLEVTGCEIGSVPPFGHKKPLETYLDPEVMENEIVNFNAGRHDVSVELSAEDLPLCIRSSGSDLTVEEIKG